MLIHEPQSGDIMNNGQTTSEETKQSKQSVDYTRTWQAMGMAELGKTLGLNIRTTKPPALLPSGVVIIAAWEGNKADVRFYKNRDGKFKISATMKESGKKCKAYLDQVDVPPWMTIGEVCLLTARHGYLRLRQPREAGEKAAVTSGSYSETHEQMALDAVIEEPEIAAAV
jgi:hypothetical protein